MDLAIPAPMLASVGRPLRPTGWAGELKWDGARLLSRCAPDGAVTLATRILRQTTSSFPEIAAALARAADGRGLVLDGELVAPHPATGHPVFARLQRRLHLTRPTERLIDDIRLQYIVFDVLADGEPIRTWPYAERRALLDGLGLDDGDRIRVPPMWPLDEVGADRLLTAAADVGLEGAVAKRLDSVYEPGVRSKSWLKTVLRQQLDAIVIGAVPGAHAATFGALVLGGYDAHGDLQVIGMVGSGFTAAARRHIAAALAQLRRDTSPVAGPVPAWLARRQVWWVEPVIVAEIAHREATRDGLRHPSFRGVRADKLPEEIGLPDRGEDPPSW
ncbi:ATP-dependent DNA ligase [Nocardia thailandica]